MLGLALGLIAVVMAALACGPSAPGEQASGTVDTTPTPTPTIWIIGDASPSELATAKAATSTPYPSGYVPPTPYPTPPSIADIGATLAASMATEAAQQSGGAGGASAATPTPSPTPTPPLTEQVTQFALDMQGRYDVVARVRSGASRAVAIPDGATWPHNQEPHFENLPGYDSLVRTTVTAVTVYYGTLPSGYELVSYPGLPNGALDNGQEYVLFISKTYANENECSDIRIPGQRCYNQTQLDAIGGEGGLRFGRQAWALDDSRAWWIPVEHITHGPAGSDLAAAKAGGQSLDLSDLENAIRQGLPE